MYTILNKISVFMFLVLLCSQAVFAVDRVPDCPTKQKPCSPPYKLTYQCVDKGSEKCVKSSQFHKECCEGILVQAQYDHPFECEDGQLYIPEDSACCDGKPYSKSWEGCCNGKTYLSAYDTCCEGRIVKKDSCCCNKIIDPKTRGCCNGKPYNLRTQACCGGEICCGISEIRLTPKECTICERKDPSCFYATLADSTEPFYAQACGKDAVIVFPEAICPDVAVAVCQHPRCGVCPVITGNPQDGYVVEGICAW